jgi:hypothetical protein
LQYDRVSGSALWQWARENIALGRIENGISFFFFFRSDGNIPVALREDSVVDPMIFAG